MFLQCLSLRKPPSSFFIFLLLPAAKYTIIITYVNLSVVYMEEWEYER